VLWGTEPIDVYVGVAACWVAGNAEQPQAIEFSELAAALKNLNQDIKATRRERKLYRRPKLRIWLSGGFARPFLIGPVAGLRRWSETVALASAAASDATGLTEPCRVVLEDWPGEQAALATAVPLAILDHIGQHTRQAGLAIQSMRPWWCRRLDQLSPTGADDAIAIEDGDALTMLRGQAGGFVLARTYAPRPPADQLEPIVARTALSEGINADDMRVARWRPTDDLASTAAAADVRR
jgi:hypothetical protein